LPDVPPLADAGVPGYNAAAWQAVIAPAKTPKDILIKLNSAINTIVGLDEVRARMKDLGMLPIGTGTPDELQRFLVSEIARWGKVVEAAGIAHSE
jgi:tripartite-type tricarboxylate transporter receptor subunit TctC